MSKNNSLWAEAIEGATDMNCTKCSLYKTRYNLVEGRGDIPADILFIGQAPGVSEDLHGRAFIGPAGQLLDKMIIDAKIDKYKKYFTNCILCRPCNSKKESDREPTLEELVMCRENVLTIVDTICTTIVVLVGDVAKRQFRKQFPSAIILTHPSALLRTGGKASPMYRENIIRLETICTIL
jgi:DNA polymerase